MIIITYCESCITFNSEKNVNKYPLLKHFEINVKNKYIVRMNTNPQQRK